MKTTKPVQPVVFDPLELKRVLYWAQLGATHDINEDEAELAVHLALHRDEEHAIADANTYHKHLVGASIPRPRLERIQALRDRLRINHAIMLRLRALVEQHKQADMEQWAHDVATSIKARQRDDVRAAKTAEHRLKTVDEQ